jgi:hypothetical protein
MSFAPREIVTRIASANRHRVTYARIVTRAKSYVITESYVVLLENDGSLDLRGCIALWASGAWLEGQIKNTMLLRSPDGRLIIRWLDGDTSTWEGLYAGRRQRHLRVTEREAFDWLRTIDARIAKRLFPHFV